jgi:hypothetical protein
MKDTVKIFMKKRRTYETTGISPQRTQRKKLVNFRYWRALSALRVIFCALEFHCLAQNIWSRGTDLFGGIG